MNVKKSILMKAAAALMLLVGLQYGAKAQTSIDAGLEKIDAAHQDCLDNGEDLLACGTTYYKAIDSMLNIVFRDVMKGLPNTEKAGLRNEQREWTATRDKKFHEIDAEARKDGAGSLERSVAIEDKAGVLRERLDELTGRLK